MQKKGCCVCGVDRQVMVSGAKIHVEDPQTKMVGSLKKICGWCMIKHIEANPNYKDQSQW